MDTMTKARNSSGRDGSVVTGNGVPAGDLVESDMRRRVTSRRRLRLVGSGQTTLAPRPSAVDDWLLTRLPGDTRAAAATTSWHAQLPNPWARYSVSRW